jgi:hypothetical protein
MSKVIRAQSGGAQFLLAMRKRAVVAMTPSVFSGFGVSLVAFLTKKFLAQCSLEHVWVPEDLFLGMGMLTLLSIGTARSVNVSLSIGTMGNTDVAADLCAVSMFLRRPPRPLEAMRELALRPPFADRVAAKTLTRLRSEDVETLLVAPKIDWQGHGD